MGKTLYLECCRGISGDMAVAALIDLGADTEVLNKALQSLGLEGFEVKIGRVKKSGIDACDFNVILDKKHENHDHDMEYLYGKACHNHEHSHEQMHNEEMEHSHKHMHGEEMHHSHEHMHNDNISHGHEHEHRGLAQIFEIIDNAGLTPNAKEMAKKIFNIIARAEAKAHGVDISKVHFHEVGAIDSIVDIIAAAVCIDNLGITEACVPVLCEGSGSVRCQHGILPVPVPAVVNIVTDNGLRLKITDTEGELVTPTGAAIAAALKTSDRLPDSFYIEKTGLGAGKRNYEKPSILRAMLINTGQQSDYIYKLETNIDDCSGEALGYLMEKLFDKGALDVSYTPVFMKKNRPAYQLNVICNECDMERLEKIIFKGTTTIGIRRIRLERTVLKRELINVNTSIGSALVKVCYLDMEKRFYPEYQSVSAICDDRDIPYIEAYNIIQEECKKLYGND